MNLKHHVWKKVLGGRTANWCNVAIVYVCQRCGFEIDAEAKRSRRVKVPRCDYHLVKTVITE